MKILTAEQIRSWDRATIASRGISSLSLMEHAAAACTEWITSRYTAEIPFVVVCGTGNNGGDGLAITRQLIARGYSALAFVVMHTAALSPDCEANLEALKAVPGASVQLLNDGDFITGLPAAVVLIDALFGTGINRKVEGYAAAFITHLNSLPNTKIAIDLPSGMPADSAAPEGAAIAQAQHTLTFQQFKRAMLHPESGVSCGEIHLIPIGLDPGFQAGMGGYWYTLDKDFVKRRYRPRKPFTHKGTHGTALLVGGTYGMVGAILLAARAAGRAGAGKVRALVPGCGYSVVQTACPEAMCETSGERFLEQIGGWESSKGIGIGPGLGREPATVAAFEAFLSAVDQPVVIDADALNVIAEHPEFLRMVPKHSILTPHPKELERIFGQTADSYARVDLAREKAIEHDIIIVAKDRYTVVALPDGRCYYNTAGNAGLATGGSGDVLCGMLAGLLAQGYTPEDAALIGVYLHAAAGDSAVLKTGMEALVAGDIVDHIGAAFLTLGG
jgi:NAD(P)H-hydrate epimerase